MVSIAVEYLLDAVRDGGRAMHHLRKVIDEALPVVRVQQILTQPIASRNHHARVHVSMQPEAAIGTRG